MRTIGTVNSSTKPALSRTLLDSLTAAFSSDARMPCRKKVIITTATRMPPGRNSGSILAPMPASPRMLPKAMETDFSALLTSGKTRLITRIRPTST